MADIDLQIAGILKVEYFVLNFGKFLLKSLGTLFLVDSHQFLGISCRCSFNVDELVACKGIVLQLLLKENVCNLLPQSLYSH
jgi:hypothetical protein